MTEKKKLERLIKFLKANGVTRLKTDTLEVDFGNHIQEPTIAIPTAQATLEKFEQERSLDPALQMPGDDEMLFFSTDYFDELKASRKAN